MTIQFIDMRMSEHISIAIEDGEEINNSSALFVGDLGIQTFAVVGTPNQSDVRVWLSGTVTVLRPAGIKTPPPDVKLFIVRNGDGTSTSGSLIYQMSFNSGTDNLTVSPISITACDFPDANLVAAGQIRYSLFITSASPPGTEDLFLIGPVAFNGMACAGTN
ncbi:hypothetical protein PCCS19_55840 [Paenibacillus sp. CCS19]|uniref:hypothetical protein n=1 Tax=Paenibacillus sp. CCS19 TaxID=3158387 RepID=UPI00256AFB5A|nr:hypothetical protein [Paenibacillus cellulosilyticus]GMK42524.1 hypothetical protein PCCS19_55840 [Paenibacillus cellulosilyticus]